MMICFQPPPPANAILRNSALKRWRHWTSELLVAVELHGEVGREVREE
jgi:hypothetical protein